MKAILEFNLPEDASELKAANSGPAAFVALRSIDNWLRTCVKHGHNYKTADEALGAARDELREILDDEGLSLDG